MTEEFDPTNVDPALWRGLTQRRFSRRDLLRYSGMGAGALGLSAVLAACGTSGSSGSGGGGGGSKLPNAGMGTTSWWDKQTLHKQLEFANWPYYIDVSHGKHPSLDKFKSDTGISVDYQEVIQDNNEFFAKIRPSLDSGQPTGYDIMVLTSNSPVLASVFDNGWVIPIDHRKMTNFNKYASDLAKSPAWDPGNKYSMAWQSGYTALAYNTDMIPEDITSVQSLFDSKYKGKVGMFTDPQELGSLGLLAIGVDPVKSTPSDWQKAADKLNQQKSDGIVRQYYDQSYIHALNNGDTWISEAWSGDIFIANQNGHTNLKLVIPEEGAMFWTDNMLIPIYAKNPLDAMTYMDYVYDPTIQAMIEGYDAYVCPVPSAQPIMAASSDSYTQAAAKSPTVFPSAEIVALSRAYYNYKSDQDLQQWNSIFQPIIQS